MASAFLDLGELKKLVAAENEWHAVPAAAPVLAAVAIPTPPDRRYPEGGYDDRDDDRGYDQRGGYQQPYRTKRKSFLSELFDD